jgi:hypothetical protein
MLERSRLGLQLLAPIGEVLEVELRLEEIGGGLIGAILGGGDLGGGPPSGVVIDILCSG